MIELQHADIADVMAGMESDSVHFVHADPPWAYNQSGVRGNANDQYEGLTERQIRQHLDMAAKLSRPGSYLVVWCTWPKLMDWALSTHGYRHPDRWRYLSGGAWGKLGTNPMAPKGRGVGFHFTGDSELLLLYAKGTARPRCGKAVSNLWNTDRTKHSEKPQMALLDLLRLATNPGDTVLDLYAGQSGSMARACRTMGRSYIGAEIDAERHRKAMEVLSQGSLF